MFETAVVKTREVAAERRFGLLSASIAAHSFVIVAVVVGSLSSTNFPTHAPNQMEILQAVDIPKVPIQLGDPNGGRKQPEPQKPASTPPPQKPVTQVTAPPSTPDRVPELQPPSNTSADMSATDNAGGGEGPGLVNAPIGDPNGIKDGLPIAPPEATPPPVPAQVFRAVGDVKPAKVLVRVSPAYPAMAARAGISGVVVVECIIGSDGQIRDPHVVRSSFAAFNQPALDAVNQWRFAPGTLHGNAVDTYFELTITFTLHR